MTIETPAPAPVRLDLGCGTRKREGHIGVDVRQFDGVDVVCDLGKDKWPWEDNSVDEVWCNQLVEHLHPPERIHFVNELHRVLKKGAKATIITPHWASNRAYGDLTHVWPPVCEWWYSYLKAEWRKVNAPHNDGYTCDFEGAWGYVPNPKIQTRATEFQQWAMEFYKESAMDLVATITKR